MTTLVLPKQFRILVVENDAKQCADLVKTLNEWGYRVYIAEASEEAEDAHQSFLEDARQKALKHRCHLAIVDMRLRDDGDQKDTSGLMLVKDLAPTVSIIRSAYGDRKTVREALNPSLEVPERAYDFVGKDDGPEALKQVIDAIEHKIWVRRKIEIVSSEEFTYEALSDQLSRLGGEVAPDEIEDIFLRLFPASARLKIEPVNEAQQKRLSVPRGHSFVVKITQDEHLASYIVKLTNVTQGVARWKAEFDELKRFNSVRPYFTENHYAAVVGTPVRLWNVAGVVYEFLSGGLKNPIRSFADFYVDNAETNPIEPMLHNFRDLWLPLYEKRRQQSKSVFRAYDDAWGGKLSHRLLEFKDHPLAYPDSIAALRLPNPLLWLAERIALRENGEYNDGGLPNTQLAICHGDLHSENIFTDTRQDVWLIDYERTGEGPLLQDFAELENDILTSLLTLNPDDEGLFVKLICQIVLSKELTLEEQPSELWNHVQARKALKTIQRWRELAKSVLGAGGGDERQLYYGVLFNSIFRLTLLLREKGEAAFISPNKLAQGTRCLILAGILCHRLDKANWNKSWPPAQWASILTSPIEVHSPNPEPSLLTLQLQLTDFRNDRREFQVSVMGDLNRQQKATSRLPYDDNELVSVMKLLEKGRYDADEFYAVQTAALRKLNLLTGDILVDDWMDRVGKDMYETLVPTSGGVRTAFDNCLHATRDGGRLQLTFDKDATALACYPWELMHDGYPTDPRTVIDVVRYIASDRPAQALTVPPNEHPCRLLYVSARPHGLAQAALDRNAVKDSVAALNSPGHLAFEDLAGHTHESLKRRLLKEQAVHVLHFDGHGMFARHCPRCGEWNHPHMLACVCQQSLADTPAKGYLAFEDKDGEVDWVDTITLLEGIPRSQIRLVILSSCQSARVRGTDLLIAGVGPGLILGGVPAVVAMQFSILDSDAISFNKQFYDALLEKKELPDAVSQGRIMLSGAARWAPVLYLRSKDNQTRLCS